MEISDILSDKGVRFLSWCPSGGEPIFRTGALFGAVGGIIFLAARFCTFRSMKYFSLFSFKT